MKPFQKNYVPKKLSTKEMWNLYRTLEGGLSDNEKEFLVDEILSILSKIDKDAFVHSLTIMFNVRNFSNPADAALAFIKGIKSNNFFLFSEFVQRIKRGSSNR